MTVLAVIPARHGSKRLPGKNMKILGGKPLIQWTIEAALNSACIDKVLVSSDCEEIINLANSYGDLAPFTRPEDLATDIATSFSVVEHAINFVEAEDLRIDHVILLQPTSPFRSALNIDKAFGIMLDTCASSVVSVCECQKSPLWSARISCEGKLKFLGDASSLEVRGQDLPKYYCLNGAIYIIAPAALRDTRAMISTLDCVPYVMSQQESLDIDTAQDFFVAEMLLKNGN